MRLVLTLTINVLCVVLAFATPKTIYINKMISPVEAENLWPSYSNTGQLFYGQVGVLLLKQRVIYFDRENGEIVTEFNLLPNQKYSMIPEAFTINPETFTCLYINPGLGRVRLGLFNNRSGKLIAKRKHHSTIADYKVMTQDSGNITFVVGEHLSSFEKFLDRYNKYTTTPSQYTLNKFKEYYETNDAYLLWKYDEKLALVDSAGVVPRTGVDLREYLKIYRKQAVDIDDNDNMHLVHASFNYRIQSYSRSLRLLNEIHGKNENFKPIPDKLFKDDAEELRSTPGSYSVVYALYAINDWLVTSFYQNPKGWDRPEGPYHYDIHSKQGEKHSSGQLPYPFFGRDDEGNVYLYVMKESDSWLGDDQYYLVEISISELLAGKVNRAFVLNRIDQDNDD